MNQSNQREQWGTRIGFILAAVGSAVGLGNMWRFPYLTAESGGASFVLLYVVLLFLIGIPIMITEFVLGRSAKKSPVGAVSQPGEPNWGILGLLFVITGFGILSYYSVIAGWTIRYVVDAVGGSLLSTEPGAYFGGISAGHLALVFHLLFMAITTAIVVGGVKSGIERSVKILIPLLFVLMVGLAVWAFTQEGSREGYSFYLQPDLEELFASYTVFGATIPFVNLDILGDAAGQTFFTLSLGMGAMITYASYLSQDEDLVGETLIISFTNFSISFLAGLTIFPLIASFDLEADVAESTEATLFIAIPKAFQQIGEPWGVVLATVFFGCLFLAALTSAISLLEVTVSSVIDRFGISRTTAGLVGGVAIFLVGIPSAYDTEVLGLADQIAGQLLLMVGGFFLAIYAGWRMKGAVAELEKGLRLPVVPLWRAFTRYVVPPALLALIITGLYDLWKTLGG